MRGKNPTRGVKSRSVVASPGRFASRSAPQARQSEKPDRKAAMNSKITPDHLGRGAVVYVRQSIIGNTESQRRQYGAFGFASVTVVDGDLARSGSSLIERPGFQRLVAS